jgi:polyketide cyclase/dehydrase/lipid transport protein
MTIPTAVDTSAPVVARHEVDIRAPLDRIWQLHIDVNSWPSWQDAITEAHMDGPFQPGNSFSWSSYGFAVTSHIYEVKDHRRTLWGGTAGGITGVHEWLFRETDDRVSVSTNESFAGDPVSADVEGMQRQLDASLIAWLEYLKSAAEARG